MSIDDKLRSRCPLTARTDWNVGKIGQLVLINYRRTIEQLSEKRRCWSSVQRTSFDDLGMKTITAKFVFWVLTDNQKELKHVVLWKNSLKLLQLFCLRSLLLMNHGAMRYDPETEQQSGQWMSSNKSNIKPMLIQFFDVCWIVHSEFHQHRSLINFYLKVLRRVRQKNAIRSGFIIVTTNLHKQPSLLIFGERCHGSAIPRTFYTWSNSL